jgi:hypothetical protein
VPAKNVWLRQETPHPTLSLKEGEGTSSGPT